ITGYDFRDNTGFVPKTDEFISEMFLKRAEKLIDEHYGDQPMFLYFSLDLPKWPSEAPQKYLDMYADIENPDRRGLSAMVSVMDNIVGNLTRRLKEKEMWEDTLFVFFSDVIVECFAGIFTLKIQDFTNHDAYDIRHDMTNNVFAIKVGDYKLIVGNPEIFYPRRSLEYTDGWHPPVKTNATKFTRTPVHFGELGDVPPSANVTMLFNLKDDPEERNNLAKDYPMKVEELRLRLKEYEKGLMPPINPPPDLKGSKPANFGGVWSPGWC
ncbi:arylsulfatase B-like, partial [Saccoglossus kowalevskii]